MKKVQEIAIYFDVSMYLLFLSKLNIYSQEFYNFIQTEVLKSHTNSKKLPCQPHHSTFKYKISV